MIKTVTSQELNLLGNYIHDLSGIVIAEKSSYLIESRLGPLLEEFSCETFGDLYYKAKNDSLKVIQNRIVDAISTNETYFFRNKQVFELLKHKILPTYIERSNSDEVRSHKLNIWSAACSTGQELYSIAIVIKETLADLSQWDINLMGSDISESSLEKARRGEFTQIEIERGLDNTTLNKHFLPKGNLWSIAQEIAKMAEFRKVNLINSFSHLAPFDIIFCRNVGIYFNSANRIKLFNNIADRLKKDGFLILGSTESLLGISDKFVLKTFNNTSYYQHV